MDNEEANDNTSCNVNGYKRADAEEVRIPVPWGHISGKWWGPSDTQPVVALHGWQDNAGTFDTLVPLLPPGIAILSIDLPGHGYSSRLPIGQMYHLFWDGCVTLRRIVKHYKWDKVKLLGHSLGGAISFLYAGLYPNEVDLLICLDIASPRVLDATYMADITGENIDKFLKYESLTNENLPSYPYDEMIKIVEDAYGGSVTKEGAQILMKRGMLPAPTPGLHYFSRDPRVKVSLLGMLSTELILTYASRIKCAYLNIRAKSGLNLNEEHYKAVLDQIKQNARKFEYHEVEGTHHVHLTEPEKVAPIIANFMDL